MDALTSATRFIEQTRNPLQLTPQQRRRRQETRHGLEPGQFAALLEAQGGCCKICDTEHTDDEPLHVDHDHRCCPGGRSCGKCVRGLLCGRCNSALGWLRDKPHLARRAARYLEGKL